MTRKAKSTSSLAIGDKAGRGAADRQHVHWLLKSEPGAYGWDDLVRDGWTAWTGVRNHQAAIYLRAMRRGDLAFFYHSNTGLEVVGIARVIAEHSPDPTDPTGRFVAVDIAPVEALARPVTLARIKATPALAEMKLLRLSRISVTPVTAAEWKTVLALSRDP
ncbi:MAG: EVE domain-containing protein [Caulobacteraceae bacterium]